MSGSHFPTYATTSRTLNEGAGRMIKPLTKSVELKPGKGPYIAQMIGFPWAGQNFVQHAVHEMTRKATAINYGNAFMRSSGEMAINVISSIPLYKDDYSGPFSISAVYKFPEEGYVLTRSYCAGHCLECLPKDYIIPSKQIFEFQCNAGVRFSTELPKGQRETITSYTSDKVKKYVILVRDPFDHIASRYENEIDRHQLYDPFGIADQLIPEKIGFEAYCNYVDNKLFGGNVREIDEEFFLDEEVYGLSQDVPCYADFYRLVQWYNYALEMLDDYDLPTHYVYFENIKKSAKDELYKITEFLELEVVEEPRSVLAGLLWRGPYYDQVKRAAITEFIKHFATESTWNLLSRYF
eukprot:CAMPEP_0172481524 /NCGR_PEP_ID=MMETSP1066-20121228/7454_1 /TAXON_ID=671091 /ORGANISM="Coscinodiscus wailesii, Strain CCMP2513" /LENGTH=351 /DNA_ID=CAMNT_0013243891 /DNA_START=175 /DNA_END=1230 /DNA_ORIENTATION=+